MSPSRSLSLLVASAFVAFSAVSCFRPQPAAPPDTRAADEVAIRAANDDWAKAVAAKDVDKSVSYYTDDAVLFFPSAPAVVGKDNIRKFLQQALAAPQPASDFCLSDAAGRALRRSRHGTWLVSSRVHR